MSRWQGVPTLKILADTATCWDRAVPTASSLRTAVTALCSDHKRPSPCLQTTLPSRPGYLASLPPCPGASQLVACETPTSSVDRPLVCHQFSDDLVAGVPGATMSQDPLRVVRTDSTPAQRPPPAAVTHRALPLLRSDLASVTPCAMHPSLQIW